MVGDDWQLQLGCHGIVADNCSKHISMCSGRVRNIGKRGSAHGQSGFSRETVKGR